MSAIFGSLRGFCTDFDKFLGIKQNDNYLIMMNNRTGFMGQLPPVTKNILLINTVVFLLGWAFPNLNGLMNASLGLFNWSCSAFHGISSFHIWQPLTYMFLHANFSHLFFNMFAVLMFAPAIERSWGSDRFLTFYLVSGVGAALVQELVWMLFMGGYPAVTIGASGAVFGILLAFGWLFPEVSMFFLFIPIPIPSRVFVGIYALVELFAGLMPSSGDNVAHFAHLGGMLFGALLILYWKKTGKLGYASNYRSPWWERFKQWLAGRFQSKQKHADKDFSGYHYQAPIREDKTQKQSEQKQRDDEVNRLLDKIKKNGYDSLTQEEKDRLFKR